ncbi:MAG: aldo/keto reductase [Planctomycetes bacterium]|nr:aldo/keto reductase [Planctomycetota bacterium]
MTDKAIEKRRFGETDIEVSALGLGTWAFGGWSYGEMPDGEAVRVIEAALEAGINFFDTAPTYGRGRSEEILGEVLGRDRERAIFCTKGGTAIEGGRAVKRFDPAFLETSLSKSLHRLKRGYTDLYLLHNPSGDVLENQGMYDWITREKKRGRIVHWGASMYGDTDDNMFVASTGIDFIELRLSLLRNDIHEDLLEMPIGFIGRSPLESGFLTGKYGLDATFDSERDHRSGSSLAYREAVHEALAILRPLVDRCVAGSLAELAVRYAARHPYPSTVVAGARTAEMLRENVRAYRQGPLPADADAVIQEARKVFESRSST